MTVKDVVKLSWLKSGWAVVVILTPALAASFTMTWKVAEARTQTAADIRLETTKREAIDQEHEKRIANMERVAERNIEAMGNVTAKLERLVGVLEGRQPARQP
jgi:hypothetical protein